MSEAARKHILLVEDQAILAMSEKQELEKYGYAVTTAITGEKAIAAVGASSDIDLILMDIDLGPGIDGTQAAEIILRDWDIPIVFLSSHSEPEIVEKTENITSYGYVVKNSSTTVLDASIKMAFRLFDAHARLQEELTERKRIEEALQSSEEKFRALFEKGPNGLAYSQVVYDNEGNAIDYRILDANKSYLELTGVDPRGKRATEAFPGIEHDPLDWIGTFGRVARTGEDVQVDHYLPQNDRWYHCVAYQVRPDQFVAEYMEITKRRQAEEAVKAAITDLRLAQDIANIGNWEFDPEIGVPVWSEKVYEIYNRNPEHGPPHIDEYQEIYGPDQFAIFDAAIQQAIREGVPYDIVLRLTLPGGAVKWIHAICQPDQESGKAGHFLRGTIQDISGWNQTEAVLEKQKTILQTAEEMSEVGSFELDTATGRLTFSDGWLRIHGCTKSSLTMEELLPIAHPEDLPRVEAAFEAAIKSHKPYTIEHRIIRQDNGEVRMIRANGKTVSDDHGRSTRLYGAVQDITERKRWESELISERRRLAAIIDGTNMGTWEWNVQTGETRISERWASIIGYTLDELSPVSVETGRRLTHDEDLRRSEELLRAHFDGESEYYEIEVRMRHKSGHWVWVLDRGKVASWTDDGKPEWVFGTHQEITRKKEHEERHMALATAAATLQACSHETFDYAAIAETVLWLSGARIAAFNVFSPDRQTFTTKAVAGLPELARKVGKLLGSPVLGRTWNYDPGREATIGERQTAVFSSLGALASGAFSASIANTIAGVLRVGEVVVVRINSPDGIHGDFTLLFSGGAHLQDQGLVETYSSMVGITLQRIQTELSNMRLVAEKETLLKEVHHRIKNNMNTVTSLLSLQSDTVEDATALNAIREAESRVQSMQTLYDQLIFADNHGASSLLEYLRTLVPQVVELFPGSEEVDVSVTCASEMVDYALDTKRLSTVGLIVNELVTNSMKYGFSSSVFSDRKRPNPPSIEVSIGRSSGYISITVEDNGVGLPGEFDEQQNPGFGLMMINAMTSQLMGTVEFSSGRKRSSPGTRVVLLFPSGGDGSSHHG